MEKITRPIQIVCGTIFNLKNYSEGRIIINPNEVASMVAGDFNIPNFDVHLKNILKIIINKNHDLKLDQMTSLLEIREIPVVEYKNEDMLEYRIVVTYFVNYHPSVHQLSNPKAIFEPIVDNNWFPVAR